MPICCTDLVLLERIKNNNKLFNTERILLILSQQNYTHIILCVCVNKGTCLTEDICLCQEPTSIHGRK